MKGRLISVLVVLDSSIFAFSAASLSRWRAIRSFDEIDALSLLELLGQPVDDPLVEVVATEVGVAVCRSDLEDALGQLEDRDVEGAAAQVVDGDLLFLLLVEPVRQGRCGRLVDDALDVEPGDPAGILRRLALGVVEVGRDGDDRLGHLLAQVRLGVALQLLEDHGADLRRAEGLAVRQRRRPSPSDFGSFSTWYGTRSLLCWTSGSSQRRPMKRLMLKMVFSGFVIAWRLATWPTSRSPLLAKATTDGVMRAALRVGDDLRLAALHDGDHGVRRAQVDADDLAHRSSVLLRVVRDADERSGAGPGRAAGIRAAARRSPVLSGWSAVSSWTTAS